VLLTAGKGETTSVGAASAACRCEFWGVLELVQPVMRAKEIDRTRSKRHLKKPSFAMFKKLIVDFISLLLLPI
jgi:hypothetical protein